MVSLHCQTNLHKKLNAEYVILKTGKTSRVLKRNCIKNMFTWNCVIFTAPMDYYKIFQAF